MIADSSVLILFARAGRLQILEDTVGRLEAPAAVLEEAIDAKPDRPDAQALAALRDAKRLEQVRVPPEPVDVLHERYANLAPGETAVLAAALDRDEDVVLLDERPARQAARLEGVDPVGSLGVLARAYREGLLKDKAALAEAVRDVLDAGLWVSADVIEAFWARVGGRP